MAGVQEYLLAFSGGMDSTVLLDVLRVAGERETSRRIRAVHVDHALHPDSAQWADHCGRVCGRASIAFSVVSVDATPSPGRSPEEAARDARYRALESLTGPTTLVLTAQHQDDQTETILLQLFRGAGLRGLSGMPAVSEFGPGRLYRPLLGYSRASIRKYAMAGKLQWIDDPSNTDLTIERNYLREEIVPRLHARWPGLAATVGRSAQLCAEAQGLLERTASELLDSARIDGGSALDSGFLVRLDDAELRLVLRRWIQLEGMRSPPLRVLQQVRSDVLDSAWSRSPLLSWSEGQIRRYRNAVFLLRPRTEFDVSRQFEWNGCGWLDLPAESGRLGFLNADGEPAATPIAPAELRVRYRQGGERCRVAGRSGQRTLKNVFQQTAIPVWMRERMPLLYIDGELAAVGDLVRCEPLTSYLQGTAYQLRWSGSPFAAGDSAG